MLLRRSDPGFPPFQGAFEGWFGEEGAATYRGEGSPDRRGRNPWKRPFCCSIGVVLKWNNYTRRSCEEKSLCWWRTELGR